MDFIAIQFLSGLASASSLFLVASGLSIIFGVTRVVNFAHGSLYMLGAYIGYTLAAAIPGPAGFWVALLGAALAVGLVGLFIELIVLRRIYGSPELFQLLATFGVVLIVQDVARWLWGPEDLLGPRAPGLKGFVDLFGGRVPLYDIFLVAVGPVVLALLWLLFNRTRWGVLVRAATHDREMVGALGVNQAWLFSSVFLLGSALAGLGGALQLPREAVNLQMDLGVVVEVFVVVVVGGLGSVVGAFIAALLIGQLHAFGIVLFPQLTLVMVFLFMAVVLVFRPWGLLGKPETPQRAGYGMVERPLRPTTRSGLYAIIILIIALAAVPLVASDYGLVVAIEILILALFAQSLHLMMGPGGMISFGHAAFFGIGAYAAALLVRHLSAPMLPALAAAPVVAGIAALAIGWFCVRLSGVYLAMLTLAFAQIVWSVAFQWVEVTGGDNGILGVWPDEWANDRRLFYYLALVLCGASVLLLRRIIMAPFGYALRAGRDSARRAHSIGIDVRRGQLIAFGIAGAFAGLAGGLFAFFKGSVFPTYLAIPVSVDALVMVLLGGVQTVSGPVVGAAVYQGLRIWMEASDYWRLILGAIIVGLVVMFPQGLVGFGREQWYRREGLSR